MTKYFTKYLINIYVNPYILMDLLLLALKATISHLEIWKETPAQSNKDLAKTWNSVVISSQVSWMSKDCLSMQIYNLLWVFFPLSQTAWEP